MYNSDRYLFLLLYEENDFLIRWPGLPGLPGFNGLSEFLIGISPGFLYLCGKCEAGSCVSLDGLSDGFFFWKTN